MKRWTIALTQFANTQLAAITDQRVQQKLKAKLRGLEYEPEKQGKPMTGDLAGYRSLRAVGQRYRILYSIESEEVIVLVVALGIRKDGDKKDIYALAKKLVRLGLLGGK